MVVIVQKATFEGKDGTLSKVNFITVNTGTKKDPWTMDETKELASRIYPGAAGRPQREDFLARPRRVKLCSNHFRGFMLVPRSTGFALGCMPAAAGSEEPGRHFMPGTETQLDALELEYKGTVQSMRRAPPRLHTDDSGAAASQVESVLEDTLRAQEQLADETTQLHKKIASLEFGMVFTLLYCVSMCSCS